MDAEIEDTSADMAPAQREELVAIGISLQALHNKVEKLMETVSDIAKHLKADSSASRPPNQDSINLSSTSDLVQFDEICRVALMPRSVWRVSTDLQNQRHSNRFSRKG